MVVVTFEMRTWKTSSIWSVVSQAIDPPPRPDQKKSPMMLRCCPPYLRGVWGARSSGGFGGLVSCQLLLLMADLPLLSLHRTPIRPVRAG